MDHVHINEYINDNGVYSVVQMIEVSNKKKYIEISMSKLIHHLGQTRWSGEGDDYISPDEVINGLIEPHYSRMLRADLSYPIIIHSETSGTYEICDGVHRLSKASMLKIPTIKSVEITDAEMERCRINK